MLYKVEGVCSRVHSFLLRTRDYDKASDAMRAACRSGRYKIVRLIKVDRHTPVVLKFFSRSEKDRNVANVLQSVV